MHPDPFRDLEVAYRQLARRPPDWAAVPPCARTTASTGSSPLSATIAPTRRHRTPLLRALAAIAREDRRAATVALYASPPSFERRLSRAATAEYRADALGELAAVILEGDTAGSGLGHRYVNRAHNRTSKHHHRVRHHGRAVSVDRRSAPDRPRDRVPATASSTPSDIADVVAARVDLERFGAAVAAAIAEGDLAEQAWTHVRRPPAARRVPARPAAGADPPASRRLPRRQEAPAHHRHPPARPRRMTHPAERRLLRAGRLGRAERASSPGRVAGVSPSGAEQMQPQGTSPGTAGCSAESRSTSPIGVVASSSQSSDAPAGKCQRATLLDADKIPVVGHAGDGPCDGGRHLSVSKVLVGDDRDVRIYGYVASTL